jgi:hypothetical protein
LPAEARERVDELVEVTGLVAAPDDVESPEIVWSLCLDRKPLSELGPISQRCLASPAAVPEVVEALGSGTTVEAPIPPTACQLFGPQRPEPKPGEPSGRPVDPDSTGGYYQPVLAWLGGTAVLGAVRLGCPLRDLEFNRRYRPNENPALSAFEAVRAGDAVLGLSPDEPVELAAGERVSLRVTWPSCPAVDVCGDGICGPDEDQTTCAGAGDDCSMPRGCAGAERYAYFDALAQTVTDRTEEMTVSWYATAGTFDAPRTGASASVGADGSPGATNGFVAPGGGAVKIWAIVRDDRGGTAWLSGRVTISN